MNRLQKEPQRGLRFHPDDLQEMPFNTFSSLNLNQFHCNAANYRKLVSLRSSDNGAKVLTGINDYFPGRWWSKIIHQNWKSHSFLLAGRTTNNEFFKLQWQLSRVQQHFHLPHTFILWLITFIWIATQGAIHSQAPSSISPVRVDWSCFCTRWQSTPGPTSSISPLHGSVVQLEVINGLFSSVFTTVAQLCPSCFHS